MRRFSSVALLAKQAALSSSDILDTNSRSSLLEDMLPGLPKRRRAGRARVMADAAGTPAPYRVNRPTLSLITDGTLGGLAGAGIGAGVKALNPNLYHAPNVGNMAGTIMGLLGSSLRRRGQMRRITEDYDDARAVGKLKTPKKPESSLYDNIVNFQDVRGRKGENEAYEAITQNKSIPKDSDPRQLTDAFSAMPYIGGIPELGSDLYDNASEIKARGTKSREQERSEYRKSLAKQANDPDAWIGDVLKGGVLGTGLGMVHSPFRQAKDKNESTLGKLDRLLANGALGGVVGAGVGGLTGQIARPAISAVREQFGDKQAIDAAFAGAGLGGLAGAARGYLQDPGKDENGRSKSRLSNALMQGGVGAGLGGAAGYGLDKLRQMGEIPEPNRKYNTEMAKFQASTIDPTSTRYGLSPNMSSASERPGQVARVAQQAAEVPLQHSNDRLKLLFGE